MSSCMHESCGVDDRIWVPITTELYTEAALHPWCIHCGQIKNISEDPGKKPGYWQNVLSRIIRKYDITQVQKRLILKALDKTEGFYDTYSCTKMDQKNHFFRTVERYAHISYQELDAHIYIP